MSDAPPAPPRGGVIEPLGKWVALLGSVVALGQAATTWITGYWNDQAEQKRAAQELALTEVKERSALASEYLKLIIAKDTAPAEKVTLLDALGSIEKHPLQRWARERHGVYRELLARSEAAFQAQRRAAEAKEGAEREEAELKARIEQLSAEAELVRDDAEKREAFRKEILATAGMLAQVSARVSLTRLSFEGSRTTLAQAQQSLTTVQQVTASVTLLRPSGETDATRPLASHQVSPRPGAGGPPMSSGAEPDASQDGRPMPPAEPSGADVPVQVRFGSYGLVNAINEVTEKITPSFLAQFFPDSARANIEIAAPYLRAALQEFQLGNKPMIAAVIATIAVETPQFESYQEPAGQGAKYEGRLGNTQPGDGETFRGRGYVGLTGRANYQAMSTRLGLGNRLIVSPEDAATPEIACRILVAWLAARQNLVRPALERGELTAARRAVAGSPTAQLERFTAVYNQVLAAL